MSTTEKNELLSFAAEENIISVQAIQSEMTLKKNQTLLAMHDQSIWQNKDGMWCTHLIKRRKRTLIKRPTKEALEEFIIEYYRELTGEPFFSEMAVRWFTMKKERGDILPQTYDKYENIFKKFFESNPCAEKLMKQRINYVSTDDLDDFIYPSMLKIGFTRKNLDFVFTILRGVFKMANREHLSEIDIDRYLSCVDKPRHAFIDKKKPSEEQAFSLEEEKMLKEYFLKKHDIRSLGLFILFETGMRVGELSALKQEDIRGDVIIIRRTEIKVKDDETRHNNIGVEDCTKTDAGTRKVIVSEEGQRVLREAAILSGKSEWLFAENGKRICESGFRRKLYRACDDLKILRRSPHKIRKTYATKLIYSGVNEEVVKSLLGHNDIMTTRRNYVVAMDNPDYLRNELKKVSVI